MRKLSYIPEGEAHSETNGNEYEDNIFMTHDTSTFPLDWGDDTTREEDSVECFHYPFSLPIPFLRVHFSYWLAVPVLRVEPCAYDKMDAEVHQRVMLGLRAILHGDACNISS